MTQSALKTLATFRIPRVEQTTASDHRKVAAPRGTPRVDDRMRAAARQREEGASLGELAKLYGVQRGTITGWCAKVAEAQADERNMRGRR